MKGVTMKRPMRSAVALVLLAVGLLAGPAVDAVSVTSASASAASPGSACC